MTYETMGRRLLRLKERSGLSLGNIAKAAGYRNASSIQRYFSDDYDVEYLPGPLAEKLRAGLVGFGNPPINETDIRSLTEFAFMLQRAEEPQINVQRAPTAYIPCNGTAGSQDWVDDAEIFYVESEEIHYFLKPVHLKRRQFDALYISTSAMAPRYNIGEALFYELERPAVAGQDAVIFLIAKDSDSTLRRGLLGRLFARTRTHIEIDILTPPSRIRIPLGEVEQMSPVVQASDLLGMWDDTQSPYIPT